MMLTLLALALIFNILIVVGIRAVTDYKISTVKEWLCVFMMCLIMLLAIAYGESA